eukprot:gene33759-41648_t
MGAQAVEFFGDVAFLCEQDHFLFQAHRVEVGLHVGEAVEDFLTLSGQHLRHQFAQGHDVGLDGRQAFVDQAGQLGAFALAAGLEFLQTLGEQGEGFGVEGLRVAGVGHQHAGPGQHLQRVQRGRLLDQAGDGCGGGAVVLESLEHALARGAHILAEVVGFGATSDGEDMVAPSGDGAIACMQQAMEGLNAPIDYINTHGTSTPVGDMQEVRAMRALFGDKVPPFSSTKSLTGHSLGATGVQEAIYCVIMLNQGFIAGSANVETPDPALGDMPLVTQTRDAQLTTVLSNSFGFGGTNASLVLRRWEA